MKELNANLKKQNTRPIFHPTFGSRPEQIVGRDDVIEEFINGLDSPIGSRDRCNFYVGQRGMGKTALLQELADRAEAKDFICADVTCYSQMNDEILEIIQKKGNAFLGKKKRHVQGATAGALGFSLGLTFTDEVREQFGFRSKFTMLADRLEEHGKGILILVDEAKSCDEMRQLAISYQHLAGEGKNIAICMAGLPQSISSVLNDDVLTFLNRANKVEIGPISVNSIYDYYEEAFRRVGIGSEDEIVRKAAEATGGFPYLMQLIGYYLVKYAESGEATKNILTKAISAAHRDMDENVFAPIIRPLSKIDVSFLKAMAVDDGESRTSDICERMKKSNSYIQPYRLRLMEAGIIESPRKGFVSFTIPYFAEYLRSR